jgi:hypothetical protein
MKKVQRKQEKKKNKKRLVDHLGLGLGSVVLEPCEMEG